MSIFRKINQVLGNFEGPDGLIVLTYHRVNGDVPDDSLVVRPREFARQMAFLKLYSRKFEVVGLDEALDYLNGNVGRGTSPSGRLRFAPHLDVGRMSTKVLITFDDGYRDNYEEALPALKRCGFPAVVFMTAGNIGKDGWLGAEEMKEMLDHGVEFGAHTVAHPHLTEIGREEARSEIARSKDRVQNATAREVRAFCYPYGDHDEEIKGLVKEGGYSCAFSVKVGVNRPGQDVFAIKRLDVLGEDSFSSFKYKVTEKYSKDGREALDSGSRRVCTMACSE